MALGQRGGFLVVDPPAAQAEVVFRRHRRMAEFVPIDHTKGPAVPVGDDVEVPQQDAVERAGAVDQALTVGCRDQDVDQRVDDGVFDADDVAAARLACRQRAPEIALFVAGRKGLGEHFDRHVEIEIVDAPLVLGRVHGADSHRDTQPLQIAREGQAHALEGRRIEQKLELEGLTRFLVDQLAVTNDPAGFLQQREGAAQVRIDTLEVMNMSGKLDIREALDWAAANRDMLMAKWEEFSGDGV